MSFISAYDAVATISSINFEFFETSWANLYAASFLQPGYWLSIFSLFSV